jgi:hypothetical protein
MYNVTLKNMNVYILQHADIWDFCCVFWALVYSVGILKMYMDVLRKMSKCNAHIVVRFSLRILPNAHTLLDFTQYAYFLQTKKLV